MPIPPPPSTPFVVPDCDLSQAVILLLLPYLIKSLNVPRREARVLDTNASRESFLAVDSKLVTLQHIYRSSVTLNGRAKHDTWSKLVGSDIVAATYPNLPISTSGHHPHPSSSDGHVSHLDPPLSLVKNYRLLPPLQQQLF